MSVRFHNVKNVWFGYLLMGIFLLAGCKEEGPASKVVPPSNLQVEIVQDTANPASVQVSASAQNTNFYRFYWGSSSDYEEQTNGEISHTFSSSGTFAITVEAYAKEGVFISKTDSVVVTPKGGGSTGTVDDSGYTTPDNYAGYKLVWHDEFDGTSLSSDWVQETGGNGWGNNELEYYKADNTTVKDGYLTIEAKKEAYGGKNYTSSRIKTQGKQSFQYGRIDIRAKLPKGQGIWPALWMLGSDFNSVGWPKCGEIDIMELIGGGAGRDNTVHGTAHWDNNGAHASYGDAYNLSSGIFNDEFHVFSIIWDASAITWYVDDHQYVKIDTTPADLDEFRNHFFFIFNVAVGGNWPGSPDASTVFPQRMVVDYVRVFQPN